MLQQPIEHIPVTFTEHNSTAAITDREEEEVLESRGESPASSDMRQNSIENEEEYSEDDIFKPSISDDEDWEQPRGMISLYELIICNAILS